MRQIKFLILYLFIIIFPFLGFAAVHDHSEITTCKKNCENHNVLSNSQNSQTVYVCTGAYAYAYHSRSDCPGLGNCKGEIRYTDEYTVVNSFRRVPCCKCWSNVAGRCKDDNTHYGGGYGGGGDNSEAYAYLALAIVATSAIILSNDVYVYPAISFYKRTKSYNYYGQNPNDGFGTGWIFGFRKTFKHSALEYGVSYLKSKVEYNYGFGYAYSNEIARWGGHFNYVHQIFYNKTPDWLKIYIGASVNNVYDFGYGGIIGTELKLFDRLRFDARYEYTSQTNQIQAGLIFTYQKKYFWQKK